MNTSTETTKTCNMTIRGDLYLPYDITLNFLNFLFGFPTHLYIVWLITKPHGIGFASEFFTLNISLCEIMFSLRSLLTTTTNLFPSLLMIVMFLSGFVITGRFFQCLVCVERYLAVVHPVSFLKYKPLRYRVASAVSVWLMIASYGTVGVVSWPCFTYIFTIFYILQFLIFISVNLFCCLTVLRALKQSGPGERSKEKEEENKMKRRAFHLILITTVTLTITYVPSFIVTFQYIFPMTRITELDSLSLTCFILPGYVQPLLFIQRSGKLPFCNRGEV